MKLTTKFFNRDPEVMAKALLGKVLRRKYKNIWLSVMIIETECYYLHDKASHSSLGYTEKRKALFMPGGTLYMYYAHGKSSMNISAKGKGNAVLVKAGIPYLDGPNQAKMLAFMHLLNPSNQQNKPRHPHKLASGQTLLCKSLHLQVKDWDQKTFDPQEFYVEDVGYRPKKIIKTKRLGIPVGRDEHLLYRFIDFDYTKFCTNNPLTKRLYQPGKDYIIL